MDYPHTYEGVEFLRSRKLICHNSDWDISIRALFDINTKLASLRLHRCGGLPRINQKMFLIRYARFPHKFTTKNRTIMPVFIIAFPTIF